MSKYFLYGSIAWVMFAFILGVVLVVMPRTKHTAWNPREAAPMRPSETTPNQPSTDYKDITTKVNVKGTLGSEGTVGSHVQVLK